MLFVKAVSVVQMCVSAAEGPSCMKCTHSLLWKTPVGTKERGERKDGGILRESMMTARQDTHTHADARLHLEAYKHGADIVAEERVLATNSVKIPLSSTLHLRGQR